MAFTRSGIPSHDALPDVSVADHHVATVASDLNLADMAERLHASLTSVGAQDHLANVTVAQMEAEPDQVNALNPSRVRNSPGVAKVWVEWEQTGAHGILVSYNMTSVTDGSAAGNTDHLYDDDFSGNNYVLVGGAETTGSNVNRLFGPANGTKLAGGVTTETETDSGTDDDAAENSMVCFGDL